MDFLETQLQAYAQAKLTKYRVEAAQQQYGLARPRYGWRARVARSLRGLAERLEPTPTSARAL